MRQGAAHRCFTDARLPWPLTALGGRLYVSPVDRLPFFQRAMPFKYYNATLVLIGINVFVFFISSFIAPTLFSYLSMIPALVVLRNWWWQVFTYMFVHADIWHLLFNMLGLFFFGVQLERRIGSHEFLLFYLISGVLAGAFSLLVYWLTGAYMISLLGASGAVFAVLLAYATYYPTSTILIFGIIPVKAPVLIVGYAAIEIFSMFSRNRGNVAHLTHLAGFGFAYLYLLIRLRINPVREFLGNRRY
jgi:membrane associated rhomboid family serine protease